jgi:hydroxymethylpyrimidine pyrophosphatase-like HAD family hydrolase
MTAIDQRFLSPEAAAAALALLRRFAVDIWVFTDDRWLVESAGSAYIAREERAVLASPTLVEHLDDDLYTVGKMVGVSDDSDRLSACETAARESLGSAVSIVRSQRYYLDFTPPGTDKGLTVDALSTRLGIPPSEIATIGDMDNDVPMFRKSGFSIAMGNATDQVKSAANATTASNEDEGFALAVENLILPSASG